MMVIEMKSTCGDPSGILPDIANLVSSQYE